MKKIFIYLEACNRRALDITKVIDYLSKNNYKIVHRPEDADIILLFTCAAADRTTDASIKRTKQFQKYNAELIVAGCLPAIEPKKLGDIFNGKTLIAKDLDDKIEKLFPPKNNIKFRDMDEGNILFQNLNEEKSLIIIRKLLEKMGVLEKIYLLIEDHILKNLLGKHSLLYRFYTTKKEEYFYIRISRGCLGNCSYCAIKKSTGSLKSKTVDEIINEFKKGLNEGYNDFIFSADDSGSYGLDIGSSFPELLDEITKMSGEYRIWIHSLNPLWLVRYIDDLCEIVKRKKIVSMFIPVQSGSSRILKLMRRYSDTGKMKDALLSLKKACPDLLLDTDFIVGFPTETKEDIDETLSFIKEINFNAGSIISFSCKTDTDAENMEPKVSREEVSRRFRYMQKCLKAEYKLVTLSKTFFMFGKK